MSQLIDLRDYFGIWDRCGNTRYFVEKSRFSEVYLNPLDGHLIAIQATPMPNNTLSYSITVHDAKKVGQKQLAQTFENTAPMPWIERSVRNFFYRQAMGWAIEAIKGYAGKDPTPGDKDMSYFLQFYEHSNPRYREEGNAPESDKPMLEETLQAIKIVIAQTQGTIADYGRGLTREQVDEAIADYGILEC